MEKKYNSRLLIIAMVFIAGGLNIYGSQKRGRKSSAEAKRPVAAKSSSKAVVVKSSMKQARSEQELIAAFEAFADNNPNMVESFLKKEFAKQGYGQLYVHKNGQTDFLNIGQIMTVRSLYDGILKKLSQANDEKSYKFWDGNATALLKFAEGPAKKSGHQWIKEAPKQLTVAQAAGQKSSKGVVTAEAVQQIAVVVADIPTEVEAINTQAAALGAQASGIEEKKASLKRLTDLATEQDRAVKGSIPGTPEHTRAVAELNGTLKKKNEAAAALQQETAQAVDQTARVAGRVFAVAQTAGDLESTGALKEQSEAGSPVSQENKAQVAGVGRWKQVLGSLQTGAGEAGATAATASSAGYKEQGEFLQRTSATFSDLTGIKPAARSGLSTETSAAQGALQQLWNQGYRWYMDPAKRTADPAFVDAEYTRITTATGDDQAKAQAVNKAVRALWDAEKEAFAAHVAVVRLYEETGSLLQAPEEKIQKYHADMAALNEKLYGALERLVNVAQVNWNGALQAFGLVGNSELAGYLAWKYWPNRSAMPTQEIMAEAQKVMSKPVNYDDYMWHGVEMRNKDFFNAAIYPYMQWSFDEAEVNKGVPSAPPLPPAEQEREQQGGQPAPDVGGKQAREAGAAQSKADLIREVSGVWAEVEKPGNKEIKARAGDVASSLATRVREVMRAQEDVAKFFSAHSSEPRENFDPQLKALNELLYEKGLNVLDIQSQWEKSMQAFRIDAQSAIAGCLFWKLVDSTLKLDDIIENVKETMAKQANFDDYMWQGVEQNTREMWQKVYPYLRWHVAAPTHD